MHEGTHGFAAIQVTQLSGRCAFRHALTVAAAVPQVAERAAAPPASLSALGESLRHEFPILDQEINGKPLAYLDNAATSQKPLQVKRQPRRTTQPVDTAPLFHMRRVQGQMAGRANAMHVNAVTQA